MSLSDLSGTPRTALRRHRERGRTERDDLYAVLDAGLICHLGVLVHGAPRVLPAIARRREIRIDLTSAVLASAPASCTLPVAREIACPGVVG